MISNTRMKILNAGYLNVSWLDIQDVSLSSGPVEGKTR